MSLLIKIEVNNTSDTALLVAMDRNPNQEVRKSLYDIGNYFNESSVRSLTNKERFHFLTVFGNHNLDINFIKYQI